MTLTVRYLRSPPLHIRFLHKETISITNKSGSWIASWRNLHSSVSPNPQNALQSLTQNIAIEIATAHDNPTLWLKHSSHDQIQRLLRISIPKSTPCIPLPNSITDYELKQLQTLKRFTTFSIITLFLSSSLLISLSPPNIEIPLITISAIINFTTLFLFLLQHPLSHLITYLSNIQHNLSLSLLKSLKSTKKLRIV